MKSQYKVIVLITVLLVILSGSVSVVNYIVSLNNAQEQLKNQSLPLSLDNIYSDIQKNIIQPYLVSSMMANDTFVHDWLHHEEANQEKIVKFLSAIKNKYNMFNTFLVSEKTKNYYTPQGLVEKVKEDNSANQWYFNFKNIQNKHEINLDFNENMSNDMIMFINYKIFDTDYQYIGATGVAIKISYVDELLKNFRVKHKFKVTFYDKNGEVVLAERDINQAKNLNEQKRLREYKDLILSKQNHPIEFNVDGSKHILNSKYIPELDLYLTIEANLDDFTVNVKKFFYLNLLLSIFMTVVIAFIVYYIIKRYSSKLEYLSKYDTLTSISNRRDFEENLEKVLQKHKKYHNEVAIIFLDIDNFKYINDTYGHSKGDKILKEVAQVLRSLVKTSDLLARWGGEEFVITLIDSSLDESQEVAERIRSEIENNTTLKNSIGHKLTISLGVTMTKESDSIDSVTSRADEAMYVSKSNGKNQITTF